MTTVDRINQRRAQRAQRASELDSLDAEIADLICQAVDEGIGPTALAKQIGISRARVYQILQSRR